MKINNTKQDWDDLRKLEQEIIRNYKPITKEGMDEYFQWMQEYYDSCETSLPDNSSTEGELPSLDKQGIYDPHEG